MYMHTHTLSCTHTHTYAHIHIYVYTYTLMYSHTHTYMLMYLPTPLDKQDVTNLLSGVLQVWIQSFPSPRLVAIPRLKSPVCPTIYYIAGGRIVGFITFPKDISVIWNANRISTWSPCPFPMTVNIIPHTHTHMHTHTHAHTHIDIWGSFKKFLTSEWWAIIEHFCYGNTLQLLIKPCWTVTSL